MRLPVSSVSSVGRVIVEFSADPKLEWQAHAIVLRSPVRGSIVHAILVNLF
jgi:hypothetical protein